jgi:predicted DCC family thiol-disulfide oxidoreductase YuxK
VCNLCNNAVQFIIKHDTKKRFYFAALQSDFGQNLLQEHNLARENFSTIILLEKEKIHIKSSAALRLSRHLRFPFSLLYFLIIVPPFIRDFVYDLIAKNRYAWFGKKESCMIPTPDLKDRFID